MRVRRACSSGLRAAIETRTLKHISRMDVDCPLLCYADYPWGLSRARHVHSQRTTMEPLTLLSLIISASSLGSLITLMLVWRKERVTVQQLSESLKEAHKAHLSWAERIKAQDDKLQAVQMNINVKSAPINSARF